MQVVLNLIISVMRMSGARGMMKKRKSMKSGWIQTSGMIMTISVMMKKKMKRIRIKKKKKSVKQLTIT